MILSEFTEIAEQVYTTQSYVISAGYGHMFCLARLILVTFAHTNQKTRLF